MRNTICFLFAEQLYTLCYLLLLLIIGCNKEQNHLGNKPNDLTDIKIEIIAGGAIITYNLPENESVQTKTAVYEGDSGQFVVHYFNASEVDGNILLDNLNRSIRQSVHSYTIDKFGNISHRSQVLLSLLY